MLIQRASDEEAVGAVIFEVEHCLLFRVRMMSQLAGDVTTEGRCSKYARARKLDVNSCPAICGKTNDLTKIAWSSVATPNQQREANPSKRPTSEPKTPAGGQPRRLVLRNQFFLSGSSPESIFLLI